jgi:hypothetical protein
VLGTRPESFCIFLVSCRKNVYNIDGFGGVSALIVKLCEADFEQSISNMIKNQTLSVA